MIKLNFLLLVGSLLFCQVVFGHETHGARSPANANKPHTHAQGVFYHDVNGNRKRDPDEKGIPGIKVSNGTEIATTNADGKYETHVSDDTIVFVIKPRGWMTPINADKLPQFYYIHKPAGSPAQKFAGVPPTGLLPESIDFP